MTDKNLFINGEWVSGEGDLFKSINPARDEIIWEGKAASAEQVDTAVLAAREAFVAWADRSFEERLAICKRFAELLKKKKKKFAINK